MLATMAVPRQNRKACDTGARTRGIEGLHQYRTDVAKLKVVNASGHAVFWLIRTIHTDEKKKSLLE